MGSCSRHSIAHKAYNFYLGLCKKQNFTESCPKETEPTGHSDGRTMQASQGRKAGGDGEEGSTEGMLRGRGRGGRCAEGDMGVTQREVLAY